MVKPRHGSRLRKIVRKALQTSGGRVTTSEIAQEAYPNLWPLPKQAYRYGDAPDFVEVGEAGIAVDHAMRR